MQEELKKAALDLSELISVLPPVHLGDLLDLTAGALASLIRAQELAYEDRLGEELPAEYYPKLRERTPKLPFRPGNQRLGEDGRGNGKDES